jgi:TRAP-type C4-dicarboxylate transport system substrate-binding protein
MKKIFILFILAAIILMSIGSFVSCTSKEAAPAKVVTLRLSGPWPPGDPVTDQLQGLVDKFNKQAAGKYQIALHPGSELVKIPESVDAVRTGAIEICGWPIGVFGSIDPRFAAAELPFAANNVEADAAMAVTLLPKYSAFMEEKFNCKAVFSFTCLALDVLSTKPVKTVADWKGLLVQAVSPQASKFIESLGGAPVPMDFPEAYQALQKKVVDATMQSSSMMIMFKLNEVAKYVTRGYLVPASIIIAINLDTYKAMPKDIQNALVDAGKQQQKEANDFFIKVAQENTTTLTKMGIDVYSLPKAERDKWQAMVQPYTDSLISAMGDFGKDVLKASDDANKKYPYK